jgi:hypothetical protein
LYLLTKGSTTKTRVAASHILIFMVSDELRNFKPYAIPVRVLKYTSLTDKNARDLKDELKSTMEDMGMVTVGMFKLYNYFIMFLVHCHDPFFFTYLLQYMFV